MIIIVSAFLLGLIGLAFGIALAISHKKLEVKEEPKKEEILEILPMTNCGACGYSGCSGYADAMINDKVAASKCVLIGSDSVSKLQAILGLDEEGGARQRVYAVIKCQGDLETSPVDARYVGTKTCKDAVLLKARYRKCDYGCLGFYDCVVACRFDAIVCDVEKGMPVVLREKCVGCGACVPACPRNLIELAPNDKDVHVKCLSNFKGAISRKLCKVACIACGICAKICEVDAIKVEDNLASIDYDLCTNCGKCVEKCPTKAIAHLFALKSE